MIFRIAASALLGLAIPAAATGQTAAREGPVTQVMSPYVASGDLAGYVSVTSAAGKPMEIVARGYADIASRRLMRPDTIFRAYSMSKPVTGVALMILYDEGKWRFDDPIAKFLPELADLKVFRGLDSSGNPILTAPASPPTMGQLVTHSAGFLYGFGDTYVDRLYQQHIPLIPKAISADDYLARLKSIPLAFEPGTQWQYSIGMDIEGIIIERLSGMKLESFLQQRLFRPLGMNDTGFVMDQAKAARLATLYEFRDGALRAVNSGPLHVDLQSPSRLNSGGGGLYTTAIDYSRFARMLLGRGSLDGRRILSPGAAQAMMSPRLPAALLNGGYGIGLQQIRPGYDFGVNGVVVTDPALARVPLGKGSYLWDGAASNFFWVDPQHRSTVVVFTQRLVAPPPALSIQAETREAVHASYSRR